MAPSIRCPVWRILDSRGEWLDLADYAHSMDNGAARIFGPNCKVCAPW